MLKRLEELHVEPLIPVPVEEIARLCGYRVLWLSTMPEDLSGIVNFSMKLIGINAGQRPARQRFSLAHELGHILLRHPAETANSGQTIWVFDREADYFASELLIPTDDLLHEVKRLSFHVLRHRYRVSSEALRMKLESLKIILPDPQAEH